MTDEKTPPKGTPAHVPDAPRQLPTIASVYNLLVGLAGQVSGARTDVDMLLLRTEAIEKALAPSAEVIPIPELPSPESLAPPATPAPRPSLAVQAGKFTLDKTGKGFKVLLWVGAGLPWIAQGIAMMDRPEYGPIVESLLQIARFIVRFGQ